MNNVMNNVLGIIEYVKLSNPAFYYRTLKEYENYCNWLNDDFLKLGHIYKSNKNNKIYILDGFKTVLDTKSDTLQHTYVIHLHERDTNDGSWQSLDCIYKMLLEDVSDKYGVSPVPMNIPYNCSFRILEQTDECLKVIMTKYHHSRTKYFVATDCERIKHYTHSCSLEYIIYKFKNVNGVWVRSGQSCLNTIRLAVNNSDGWCHDTGVYDNTNAGSRCNECIKNLRKCKKKYLGTDSLAKCKPLFANINYLKTDMFIPYPIKYTT